MKKFILTLALVCSATMGFASSAVDSAEVKKVFAKVGPQGVTYDFNAGETKIAQLTQDIENYKAKMSQSADNYKAQMNQSSENYKAKMTQSQ